MTYLRELKSDICFIQETHLLKDEIEYLRKGWVGKVYGSSFSTRSRGVAILIQRHFPMKVLRELSDRERRMMALLVNIQGYIVALCNIYAPSVDDGSFYRKVAQTLQDLGTGNIILGGDFNTLLNKDLDRSVSVNGKQTDRHYLSLKNLLSRPVL